MADRGPYCHDMSNQLIFLVAGLLVTAIAVITFIASRLRHAGRPVPVKLRRGQPLPDFRATDESGDPVRSTQLHGTAAVILFVRGNWCPFCSSQVEDLSEHYKDIVDLGARLILVTPKPLETTRRVAAFFEVEFDFWLDADLAVARQLGLLEKAGVPEDHRKEYGNDTVWPTALVVDRNGVIVYSYLSRSISDRPDAKVLLQALATTLAH